MFKKALLLAMMAIALFAAPAVNRADDPFPTCFPALWINANSVNINDKVELGG